MICRHRVTEHTKRTRTDDLVNRTGLHSEPFKKWRLLNIRARLVPLVIMADARRDLVPLRILIGEIAV